MIDADSAQMGTRGESGDEFCAATAFNSSYGISLRIIMVIKAYHKKGSKPGQANTSMVRELKQTFPFLLFCVSALAKGLLRLPEARQKQTESDCGAVTQFGELFPTCQSIIYLFITVF